MTYDAARQQVVLYGGGGEAGLPRNEDTWVWDGSTWELVQSAVGSGPGGAVAMSYDVARERVVLYGGDASVWEFEGSVWQLVDQGTTSPPRRGAPGMVYDPIRQRVLLFGGQNSGTYFTDTWTWDGSSWSDITAEVGALPRGRTEHAAAYDSASGGVIFYGGYGDTGDIRTQQFDETYVVRDGTWTEVSPDASPTPRDGASMTYDAKREVVFLYGGTARNGGRYPTDSWTWDGKFWRRVVHDSLPAGRLSAAMAYDAVREEVVLFGGAVTAGPAETFTWNGDEWRLESPAESPSGSQVSRMVWDAAREEILLYGLDGTWTWDGSNWTFVTDANPASAFGVTALTYDPVRGAPVLLGSRAQPGESAPVSTAWTWDGTAWTELQTGGTPPEPRAYSAAFWDTRRDALVLFGGVDAGSSLLADTWELHGEMWRNLTPAVNPTQRQRHAMAFDDGRNRGVLFGGELNEGYTWEWIGSAALPID